MGRRMTRAARRDALLDAAAGLVADGGVASLRFDALAHAAGVAPSLPYAYFEDVDEILLTLFDRVIGELDDRVAELAAGDDDLPTLLADALAVWFDAVRDHGRLVGALLDGAATPALAAAVRRRDLASHKRWREVLLANTDADGADVEVLAAMVNVTATATVQLWVGRRGSRAALTEAFVRAVVAAAGAR